MTAAWRALASMSKRTSLAAAWRARLSLATAPRPFQQNAAGRGQRCGQLAVDRPRPVPTPTQRHLRRQHSPYIDGDNVTGTTGRLQLRQRAKRNTTDGRIRKDGSGEIGSAIRSFSGP